MNDAALPEAFPLPTIHADPVSARRKVCLHVWIRKLVATSLLAIAATGVSAATSHGETAVAAPTFGGPTMTATDQGMTVTAGASEDGTGITAHLVGGRFDVSPDGNTITITNNDGSAVQNVPTVFANTDRIVRLSTEVSADGSTITMHPTSEQRVVSVTEAQEIGLVGSVAGMVVGFFAGAVAGCMIGLAGLIVGCVPMIFIGAIAGTIVGAVAGALVL
ncbi:MULTISPECIES: hypothetical protein [unclassified Nocardia]|uniref:hypothetical protein n=2 Tax=Nocardia TaxID=1817 RepID=UPI00278BFB6E|nr:MULTISPECIES: hypothetical protein [unclassified Nocardia]